MIAGFYTVTARTDQGACILRVDCHPSAVSSVLALVPNLWPHGDIERIDVRIHYTGLPS